MYNHAKLVKLSSKNVSPTGIYNSYFVKGHYLSDSLKVGNPFSIIRYNRNGVKVFGAMVTTPVTKITETTKDKVTFETENSVFTLKNLPQLKRKKNIFALTVGAK